MATILIVEADRRVAGHMARALQAAGHTPIIPPDAGSVLQEALGCPDLMLLDLGGLRNLPGTELLRRVRHHPETAQTPVVLLARGPQDAAQVIEEEKGSVTAILLKPVSGAQLCQAVDTALARQAEPDVKTLELTQDYQRSLIKRLILKGPDPLAFHVYRRLSADRTRKKGVKAAEVLTWAEIAEWARREGLVDAEEARLLRRMPAATASRAGEGPT